MPRESKFPINSNNSSRQGPMACVTFENGSRAPGQVSLCTTGDMSFAVQKYIEIEKVTFYSEEETARISSAVSRG